LEDQLAEALRINAKLTTNREAVNWAGLIH
jgi:hypothetical protein